MHLRVLSGLLLCSSLVAQAAVAQPFTFQRDDRPSTIRARGIAVADFNRDGWIDIVTAHHDPDGISVLTNRGAAGGYTATFLDLPGGPFDVVTGDLNKDGVPDIAVANADANAVNVLYGRAAGGFEPRVDISGIANPRALTIADVDEDGSLDIVVTEFTNASVKIFWGDGRQSFVHRAPGALPTGTNPQGVAVADFDVDGRPDIVSANSGSGGLTIHYQTAANTFTRRDLAVPPQQNVVTVGDFDRDGRPDIAAASTNSSDITVVLNQRSGMSTDVYASGGGSPRGIVAADLNRDGVLDLITGNRGTSTMQVLLGEGDGRFAGAQGYAAGSGSRAVAYGDFDNDGRVDLVSANESAASVTVLSNTTLFPRAAFKFRRQMMGPGQDNSSSGEDIDVADFDHDGRLDAIVTGNHGLHVRFGDGRSSSPASFGVNSLSAVDVNGDGHADIVTLTHSSGASNPSRIETFIGDGSGGFPQIRTTPTALVGVRMEVADFDRDGRIDLIMTGRTDWFGPNRIDVYRGNGDGTFALARSFGAGASAFALAIGDVDRDGDPDVVTTERGGATNSALAVTRLNEGGFNFSAPRQAPLDAFIGMNYAELADLNHDGFLDFAGAGSPRDWRTHYTAGVLLGGPSGFGAATYLATTENGLGVNIGDLTMDGHPDLITDDGVLFKGHGDGTFAEPELFDYFGPNPRIVDFDGDGLLDVVAPADQGSVELILNQRGDDNTAPTVDLGQDFTIQYRYQFSDGELEFWARTTDPDLHKPTFRWRMPDGTVRDSGTSPFMGPTHMDPGRHEFFVDVSDGRGGTATDSVVITVLPEKEIFLHAGVEWWTQAFNNWQLIDDATAASGKALHDVNAGQPKVTIPSASPGSYADVSFIATNTETYKVWVRLKADGNHWANDSLWLQVSGAVDANGRSYAPGTTSGIEVNLEECSGCGVSGWGWRDEAWGQRDRIGTLTLRFEKNGWQTIRIQTREDGVSIDQIVLSSEKYRTTRPGTTKNDNTILPGIYYW